LRPEKGIDVLLSAWSLVRDLAQEQGVKLVIAGSGPSDYEEQLRRSTVGDSTVEFLGTLKAEAIAWLYQQARLTVIPSVWYENLPNSLLESYACGTPVLASAIGSLAEYVTPGETGWTFTAGSSSDLAAGLRTALLDHDRIDGLSRGARRRAVAEHCAELHLNRLLTIFSELCAGNELREEEPALWI
jgi:glycosyltransferase involved in cell wall biosynthesis